MIEVGGNRNSQDQVQVQVYPVRTSGFQVPHCSQPKGAPIVPDTTTDAQKRFRILRRRLRPPRTEIAVIGDRSA
jgi:hypothetical protein